MTKVNISMKSFFI